LRRRWHDRVSVTGREIDIASWPGREAFRLFRSYDSPHYAVTARVNVSALMLRRDSLPVFRTCLWVIGQAMHAVPEVRLRFRDDVVTEYTLLDLSPTIATPDGFRYTYLPWHPDRATFDTGAAARIAAVRAGAPLNANTGAQDAVAYLSCLPWLDYTSLDNALPGPDDCIPRVSWGRIVPTTTGHDMAMTLQVHHALVHGQHVGQFFAAVSAGFAVLAA
jgi:chloramphenicol O-acetyltransferase type A